MYKKYETGPAVKLKAGVCTVVAGNIASATTATLAFKGPPTMVRFFFPSKTIYINKYVIEPIFPFKTGNDLREG